MSRPRAYLSDPLPCAVRTRLAAYTNYATLVHATARLVFAIFRLGNRIKIPPPVVGSHAVAMIQKNRVFARDHFPDYAMQEIRNSVYANCEVAANMGGANHLPNPIPIVGAREPGDYPGILVIVKELEKSLLLGQLTESHGCLLRIAVARAGEALKTLRRPDHITTNPVINGRDECA